MSESQDQTNTPREPTQQELTREIASIDRSISEMLFYGGNLKLLLNNDSVLRQRGKSLELYADLERDAHVASQIRKRKSAVTAREWSITPASEDARDVACAELVKNTFKRLRFDKLTKVLLDSVLKGFSVAELMWDVVDGPILGMPGGRYVVPVKFKKRDQRRFVFDINDNARLITKEKPLEGEELPNRKFVVHTSGDVDESPYGRGIGHAIFWPVFFKRQNISFWLVFNDKFGSPTAKGTYPIGATPAEQDKLLATLSAISRTSSVIIPEGMVVELLEAAKAGNDGYERMCAYMDAEISKAVLGETLTTSVGENGGNRALGDVHNEVRLELAKDDADELSYTLNETVVKWIAELNFPGRMPPTVWREFEEEEGLDAIADRDTKLKSLGWQRTDESFIETYGEGYERVQQPGPQADSLAPQLQFSEAKPGLLGRFLKLLQFSERNPAAPQAAYNREVQQTIAAGSERLASNWQELLGPRVNQLQSLLDETGDLALFRERLNEMINDTPDQKLVETIARSTFASHLAGRVPKRQ